VKAGGSLECRSIEGKRSARPCRNTGVARIDTARCRVALLTGEYDYSCTPAMTEAVAQAVPGAHFKVMERIGHFPMIENYPGFRPYLLDALKHVAGEHIAAGLMR
jgi:pimeloyl-ACP methyl ester carboxylesterase